jgi:hypothetical protein
VAPGTSTADDTRSVGFNAGAAVADATGTGFGAAAVAADAPGAGFFAAAATPKGARYELKHKKRPLRRRRHRRFNRRRSRFSEFQREALRNRPSRSPAACRAASLAIPEPLVWVLPSAAAAFTSSSTF